MNNQQKECNKFHIIGSEWTALEKMKYAREDLTATIGPDGKIYAIGGYGGDSKDAKCDWLSEVEVYDIDENK